MSFLLVGGRTANAWMYLYSGTTLRDTLWEVSCPL